MADSLLGIDGRSSIEIGDSAGRQEFNPNIPQSAINTGFT